MYDGIVAGEKATRALAAGPPAYTLSFRKCIVVSGPAAALNARCIVVPPDRSLTQPACSKVLGRLTDISNDGYLPFTYTIHLVVIVGRLASLSLSFEFLMLYDVSPDSSYRDPGLPITSTGCSWRAMGKFKQWMKLVPGGVGGWLSAPPKPLS